MIEEADILDPGRNDFSVAKDELLVEEKARVAVVKKRNVRLIALVVILIGGLIGGWWWLTMTKLSTKNSDDGVTGDGVVQEEQTHSEILTSDDLVILDSSTWMVAQNSLERYFLKYPPGWKVQERERIGKLTLTDQSGYVTLFLLGVSSRPGSKDEVRTRLNQMKADNEWQSKNYTNSKPPVFDFWEYDLGNKYIFIANQNWVFFVTVLDASSSATFQTTRNSVDPNIARDVNTIYSTFRYDSSLDGKNVEFKSDELGVSFEYPSELGSTNINQASTGRGGSKNSGEDWWLLSFNYSTLNLGHYEVSASTSNFAPSSWEGPNRWLNTDIAPDESEEIVKQKLEAEGWNVVKVEKQQNGLGVRGFLVWKLDCYHQCDLSRVYVIPIENSKYNNLLIYSELSTVTDSNTSHEQAGLAAKEEISKIDSGNSSIDVHSFMARQDVIFGSLKLE